MKRLVTGLSIFQIYIWFTWEIIVDCNSAWEIIVDCNSAVVEDWLHELL
jgi:hypothetical protein